MFEQAAQKEFILATESWRKILQLKDENQPQREKVKVKSKCRVFMVRLGSFYCPPVLAAVAAGTAVTGRYLQANCSR